MVRSEITKLWLNFVLRVLSVNFGGPAGGVPTWRLDTPPCGSERRTWVVETVVVGTQSVGTVIFFPGLAKSQFHMAVNYLFVSV